MEKKLHRIPEQAVFGGVASGIAQYLNIDVVIVRVLFVVMLLLPIPPSFGWTGILYIILWAVLPTGPSFNYNEPFTGDINPKPADPVADKKRSEQTVMILGGVLIFFGAIMLVDDLPIWYQFKRYAWPLIFIAVGAFLILRQRDKNNENGNTTVYPTTPPPTEPVNPVTPEPTTDPQPYRPFTSPSETHFPEDPENKKRDSNDDDDQVIKVN